MKLCIDLERHNQLLNTDLHFSAWIAQLNNRYLTEIRPLDESLTTWEADQMVADEDNKLTGEIRVIQITTTRCKPEWLVARETI